jgi:hypothetical protein
MNVLSTLSFEELDMNSLTASDRNSLIKLAASLPQGDETRRAVLAGLKFSAPKIKPDLHPLVSQGNYPMVTLGDEVIKAIKSQINPVTLKTRPDVFGYSRKAIKTEYYCNIWVNLGTPKGFSITIRYDKSTAPRVEFRAKSAPLDNTPISIPTSTGVDPDGTINVNTTSPDKLIKFLLDYMKRETLGYAVFKGDNSESSQEAAKSLVIKILASFKKAAAPIIKTISYGKLYTYPVKNGMVMGHNMAITSEKAAGLKKVWDATISKFSSSMAELGVVSSYKAPLPAKEPGKVTSTGEFILTYA